MANFALTNAVIFVGGNDVTGVSNKLTAQTMAAELDVTTFGQTYTSRIGGLKDASMSASGFADFSETIDADSISSLGGSALTCTFGPTGADGSTAYFFNGLEASYKPVDNAVGEAAGYEIQVSNAQGTAATVPGMVRGKFILPKTTISGTVDGSTTTIGATGSSQRAYVACHVFTAGSSMTLKVQSAVLAGSWTDRVTYTNPSVGANVQSVAGAITATLWRATVTAVSGTYAVAIAVGIA